MSTLAPPVGPWSRHLLPGSEFGDGTVDIRAGKHLGIDFQPEHPGGDGWVHAVEDGTVEALFTEIPAGSKRTPLYPGHTGNIVAIRTTTGRVWTYQHGRAFQVRRGQHVKAGDRLFRMWRSGTATGNHLHLGLRVGGRFVDPEPVLRRAGIWPIGNTYYTASRPTSTPPPTKPKEWTDMASREEIEIVVRTVVRQEIAADRAKEAVQWPDSQTGELKSFTQDEALGWIGEHWSRETARDAATES